MEWIAESKIAEEEVIEESKDMLSSVFRDLVKNKKGIGESLKNGLRTDKIVGTCEKCGSELLIRRGRRGGRFIGCSGYPQCKFSLPLPKIGSVIVTDKLCDQHRIFHLRIINKSKRPWELGCPHCNYLDWQAKKAQEGERKSVQSKAENDGLGSIEGIGPKTIEKLGAAGVKTREELLKAKAESLAKKTGISPKKILAWQAAARATG